MTDSLLTSRLHPEKLKCIHAALTGVPFEQLRGKCVLITGARGFFGRYLVEALLYLNEVFGLDIEILAMDSFAVGKSGDWEDWRNLRNITFFQHDVQHELGHLYGKAPDFIFHLAGIASPYWYKKLPLETIDVAVRGTRNLLDLAVTHKAKFLFTSSSEVYQTAEQVPTPESYVGAIPSMTDRSCYDVSKLLAETLCYTYAKKHDLHATVVRIFNSFGPGMAQSDRRILTQIATAAKTGKPVSAYLTRDRPMPRRTYTPVANTLRGLLFAALQGESCGNVAPDKSGVYNIGSEFPEMTVPDLVDRVREVTGLPVKWEGKPPPAEYVHEPQRRVPNIDRLRRLGYTPAMELDDGLRAFFNWTQVTYT